MTWSLELINLAEQMLRTGRTWLVLHPAVATEKKLHETWLESSWSLVGVKTAPPRPADIAFPTTSI